MGDSDGAIEVFRCGKTASYAMSKHDFSKSSKVFSQAIYN